MILQSRRGIALVTALLVVLLLHALVAALLAGLTTDAGLLVESDRNNEAQLRAKGAIHYALEQLNGPNGGSWENAHSAPLGFPEGQVPGNADTAPFNLEVRVWVQPTDQPDIMTVRAAATAGQGLYMAGVSAVRQQTTPGQVYALEANLGGPDSVYSKVAGASQWDLMEPPMKVDWSGPSFLPVAVDNLAFPEADSAGSLYLVDPAPGSHTVYRYDPGAARWTVLPRLNSLDFYGLATGGQTVYAAVAEGIVELRNPSQVAWHPAQPPTAPANWRLIPQPPVSFVTRGGQTIVLQGIRTRGIDADGRGNLYARLFGNGERLARYDGQAGTWSFLPTPPAVTYEPDGNGGFRLVPLAQPPLDFSPPTVDAQGNLYVAWKAPFRSDIPETIYRFTPEGRQQGSIALGTWKVLPPAPFQVLDTNGQVVSLPNETARNFSELAIDNDGHLLSHYRIPNPVTGINTIYDYDTSSGASQMDETLPGIRKRSWSPGAGGYQLVDHGSLVRSLSFVTAGGADRPVRLRYAPVSWF